MAGSSALTGLCTRRLTVAVEIGWAVFGPAWWHVSRSAILLGPGEIGNSPTLGLLVPTHEAQRKVRRHCLGDCFRRQRYEHRSAYRGYSDERNQCAEATSDLTHALSPQSLLIASPQSLLIRRTPWRN